VLAVAHEDVHVPALGSSGDLSFHLGHGEVETVGDIYTVGGQLVPRNSTVKGLPEGIYMINGNKVVVRK
jgi:hypothetical protein